MAHANMQKMMASVHLYQVHITMLSDIRQTQILYIEILYENTS